MFICFVNCPCAVWQKPVLSRAIQIGVQAETLLLAAGQTPSCKLQPLNFGASIKFGDTLCSSWVITGKDW